MENSHSSVPKRSRHARNSKSSQARNTQPEQSDQPGGQVEFVPAAPLKRLYAFLIDFFVVSIPNGLIFGLIYDKLRFDLPLLIHDLIFWGLFALVTTFCTARFGATLGKKIQKIKAVQHHNSPLTIYQFFLREMVVSYGFTSLYTMILIFMISGLDPTYIGGFNLLYLPGFVIGLGFFLVFRRPYMPLHDKIFRTGVISTGPALTGKSIN